MKIKFTILALCACSIAILPAQTAAPEKPATEEKVEEPKAETPLEKQAFKIFDVIGALPEIMGSIKDEASLAAAEVKLAEIAKKIKTEEAELNKLPVPDNAARTALSKKLEFKEKAMNEKMMPVMMGMQKLDPALAMKIGPMMQKFGETMQESEETMNKYFKTDEEKAKEQK